MIFIYSYLGQGCPGATGRKQLIWLRRARKSSKEMMTLEKNLDQGMNFQGRAWREGNLRRKLKLKCFGHLMQRTDSLEKTLILGKTEGRRRRDDKGEMVGWHH